MCVCVCIILTYTRRCVMSLSLSFEKSTTQSLATFTSASHTSTFYTTRTLKHYCTHTPPSQTHWRVFIFRVFVLRYVVGVLFAELVWLCCRVIALPNFLVCVDGTPTTRICLFSWQQYECNFQLQFYYRHSAATIKRLWQGILFSSSKNALYKVPWHAKSKVVWSGWIFVMF